MGYRGIVAKRCDALRLRPTSSESIRIPELPIPRCSLGSLAVTTVPEACQAAVDDQARALAAAWGLLSRSINSNISGDASDDEAVAVAKHVGQAVADGSTPSSPSTAATGAASAGAARPAGNNCGDGGGGRAERGGGTSRKDWAPLWEAMAMLSAPSVSVGAVGAGECPF